MSVSSSAPVGVAAVSSTSTAPPYQDLGLASGMNDSSIIQSLVALQQLPIDSLQNTVATDQSDISSLGTIANDLAALGTSVSDLTTNGVTATEVTSNNTAFSASTTTGAEQGSYTVQVTSLAQAAEAQSQAFTNSTAPVTGGTLQLSVNGTAYSVNITDGEQLSNVASAINASGAPVSATVLNTGTAAYLSITNQNTGYTIGQPQSSALSISETTTGSQGQALNATVVQQATNSAFLLDNLPFTRTTNTVTDAIPGVTLNLQSTESSAETLSIGADATGTQQNLQSFVTAYNQIMTDLNTVLSNGQNGQAVGQFAGDTTLTTLQEHLQSVTSAVIAGLGGIDSLADLGITPDKTTGILSIDSTTFTQAFDQNPQAASQIFSQAGGGINAMVGNIVTEFTAPTIGFLNTEASGLQDSITGLDQHITQLQSGVTQYTNNLTAQFTAMENTLSSLNTTQAFLNENEGLFTGNNSSDVTSGSSSSKVL